MDVCRSDERTSYGQAPDTPPAPPPDALARSNLMPLVDPVRQRRFTLALAPKGYGKTVLLAQWWHRCNDAGRPVHWLTLRPDDNAGTVCTALSNRYRARAAAASRPHVPDACETPDLSFLDEIPLGLTLFVDGYTRDTDGSIGPLVSRLLSSHRHDLHIVMGANITPDLPLATLTAYGQLSQVTSADLSFDLTRTQLLLSQIVGPEIDLLAVREVHMLTEGWPVGLRMVTAAAKGRLGQQDVYSPRTTRLIDAFFQEAVLIHLSAVDAERLVELSSLRNWKPELCAKLLADRYDPSFLEKLFHDQLFICENADGMLRPHRMFAAFLQRKLSASGDPSRHDAHGRAAAALADCGEWADAVEQAIAAGELTSALAWARHCALKIANRGESARVREWVEALAGEDIFQCPELCLAAGIAYFGSREPEKAFRFLTEGERAIQSDPHKDESHLLEQILLLKIMQPMATDNSEMVRESSRQPDIAEQRQFNPAVSLCEAWCAVYEDGVGPAAAILRQSPSSTHDQPGIVHLIRLHLQSLTARLAGDLREAETLCQEMRHFARLKQGPTGPMSALAAAELARHAYEQARFDDVEHLLADCLPSLFDCGSVEGLLAGYFALVRSKVVARSYAEALAALAQLEDLAQARRLDRLIVFCRSERTLVHLSKGDIGSAQACAAILAENVDLSTPASSSVASATRRAVLQTLARVMIRTGDIAPAIEHLLSVEEELDRLGFRYELACIQCLLAIAHNKAGQRSEAMRNALSALVIGERAGLMRTFADCGIELAPVLNEVRLSLPRKPQLNLTMGYVTSIVTELNRTATETVSIAAIVEATPLSAREAEILQLIANGLSNKAAGRALNLSNETVKWHLRNIYEKLGVENRIEATQTVMRQMQDHVTTASAYVRG